MRCDHYNKYKFVLRVKVVKSKNYMFISRIYDLLFIDEDITSWIRVDRPTSCLAMNEASHSSIA